ncbi:heme NO-binding domain-containing protein [Paenibacillus radicis (ex Xue et al. 2023)]|uniref:Heme NO-binding domain-containing protein n=1 Tax=Paenibacillus radicis (ex Xue et al. 2023) TaxID=2972489 RepID=A0ABT1YNM5_9BACL|nr:heme NO-binding domain-containing protein [Paenibacillus radicis (ex Xue et al. 2023)]MCR8634779.1 heme NO-binding domain-containing protein [Paenibacillus radicis (ex Xue et al. 2023)]
MKGIVFTAFIEMVESKFSLQIADHIIGASDLPSGGSYTAVGTYDHNEIIRLVVQLSGQTGIPVADLVRTFGEYLFGQLVELYPQFVDSELTIFEFLQKIDGYIHVEVRKLYPDAELPGFECDTSIPGTLKMTYRSSRPFADLAEGLILGAINHYNENIAVEREDFTDSTGAATLFILTKQE